MNTNLYWTVYKSIERELIELSNMIHIDDNQLKVYSIKISELLIRTVVEVESISKELYFQHGGTKLDDNNLFFDTDCMELLESKWLLSKKQVSVSAPNFYFGLSENIFLTPLKKANKRSSSSSDWLKAYQAVKHNRAKSLSKGNIKHLIRALAGLYVLNLYYKNAIYELGQNGAGTSFDSSLGSSLFSIKIHIKPGVGVTSYYIKNPDYDECVYLLKPTDETRQEVLTAIQTINDKANEKTLSNINFELEKQFKDTQVSTQEGIGKILKSVIEKIQKDNFQQAINENTHLLRKALGGLKYQGILNTQQY